jgi:vanillate O-demethylase monooxygenase subunit
MKSYIQNTWYVAATSKEINTKTPLARTVCDIAIAFFRDSVGVVQAVEDFCPHRGAPLSLGYVEDGMLVCGYHGLKMGSNGKVASMPNQKVSHFPCIRSIPVVERYGFIWIWPGDKTLADAALIPQLHWADNPDWAYAGGLFHIKCDYRLMIDNLMDLTHETYVHASSIGQKEIDETPIKTTMEGSQVVTRRFIQQVYAPPFWRAALKANQLADDVLVDRWQVCRFDLPSHIMIEVGVAHAGHGGYDAPADKKAGSIVVDFITPETEHSMWYFWGMARNFKPQDTALTAQICAGQGAIFTEDLQVLERQQQNLQQFPDRELLKLDIDSGGVMARRLIQKQLKAEAASAAVKEPQCQP